MIAEADVTTVIALAQDIQRLQAQLWRAEAPLRRQAMYQMRVDGLTLDAIGFIFGVSRERVRQLVKRVEQEQAA